MPLDISTVTVSDHEEAVTQAINEDHKWPLLLDSTQGNPVTTFYNYSNGVILDMKRGLSEACILKSKSIAEVCEDWRQTIVNAMVQKPEIGSMPGKLLIINFTNSATDVQGKFAAEMPELLELFDCIAMESEATKKKFLRDGDWSTGSLWGKEFKVIVISQFEKDDVEDFLKGAIPLDKLKVIDVVQNS